MKSHGKTAIHEVCATHSYKIGEQTFLFMKRKKKKKMAGSNWKHLQTTK